MAHTLKESLDNLEQNYEPIPDSIVQKTHHQVFEKIDCLDCGNCCKSAPPIVFPKDIKRIGKHLGLPPKTIIRKYVIKDYDGSMSFHTVPCIFLQTDNKCSIYESRPDSCRDYPHTTKNLLGRRRLHEVNALICPAVEKIIFQIEEIMKENKL